jgi:hypothetical protein
MHIQWCIESSIFLPTDEKPYNFTPYLFYLFISGKGDLVGCDITKHWEGAAAHDDVVVKSSADVRALTYCDIKRIHIPGLVDVLKLYPEFQERFAEEVCHDLTYNLREGYDADVSFIFDYNALSFYRSKIDPKQLFTTEFHMSKAFGLVHSNVQILFGSMEGTWNY